MVRRKRTNTATLTTKPTSPTIGAISPTNPTIKAIAFSPDRRITVSVGTALDFGKVKINLSLSENIKNDADASAQFDELYDSLTEKLEEKFIDLCKRVEGDENNPVSTGADDLAEDAGDEDDLSADDLSEDDVLAMKKSELIELIEEEELGVDIKLPIKKLKEVVIDALFVEEDEDADDPAEDTAAGTDADDLGGAEEEDSDWDWEDEGEDKTDGTLPF